jgi:hypothetical protein
LFLQLFSFLAPVVLKLFKLLILMFMQLSHLHQMFRILSPYNWY